MKKFLATLLIACFTLTVSIGCSGDTTKDKKDSKKDEPAKTATDKKDDKKDK